MSGKNSGFSLPVQPPSYVLHPNFPLSLFEYWKAQAVLGLVLVLIGIFVPAKANDGVPCPGFGDLFGDILEVRCLGLIDQGASQETPSSGFRFGEGYPAKFTFKRKGSPSELSEPLDIKYETINSTTSPQATSGDDYMPVSGTLSFAANDTDSQSIEIMIRGDSTYEATEYLGLKITVNERHEIKDLEIYEKQQRTITITPSSPIGIPETKGNNNKQVTFDLDNTVPHDFTIGWTLYDSDHRTATVASGRGGTSSKIDIDKDELELTDESERLAFPANTSSATGSLKGIIDDDTPEPDEQFALTFRAHVGKNKPILFNVESGSGLESTTATRSFTIQDDDGKPTDKAAIVYLHGIAPIQYFPLTGSVFPSTRTKITEGGSTTITATLRGTAPAQDLTIPLKPIGFPSTTVDSADFDLPAAITISAGQTSGTATLKIKSDGIDERHYELLAIEIDESKLDSNYERGDRNRFEVVMIDVNKTPVKLRNLSSSEIDEDSDAKLTFEIELARPPNGPVTSSENAPFTVDLDEGQPSFALKYTPVNPAKGGKPDDFFAPDKVDGSECAEEGSPAKYVCTVTISPEDDDLWERDETFKIDLNFGTSTFNDGLKAADGPDGHKPLQFTIKDDETQPKFSIEAATATEGTNLAFKVKRTGATGNRISVRAQTKDDTGANHAIADKDYTANSATLTFGEGVTDQNFSVASSQDILDEENETFLVTLAAPRALDGLPAPAIETSQATGTINDDDPAPNAITITVDTDTDTQGDQDEVDEGDGDLSVNVTAEITSPTRFSTDKTVVISVGDIPSDSSTEGEDYTSVPDFDLKIPAGEKSFTEPFTLKLSDDDIYELDETISVTGKLDGVTFTPATITIGDDEPKPTVTLSLTDASIGENGGSTNVEATLSGEASETVELTVKAAALAPAVNSDFTLSDAKTLTIAAGATASTETVTITAVNNEIDAENKKVSVSATASGGHDVEDPEESVTLIIEDDDTRGVTLSAGSKIEIWESDDPDTNSVESTQNEYTIVLDSEPTGDVTVNLKSSETSVASVATVTPTSITFTPSNWNQSRTITVSAVDDNIDNPEDKRTTEISHTIDGSGTDYADLTIDNIEVTVNDEDAAPSVINLAIDVSAAAGAQTSAVEDSGEVEVTVTATISGATRFAENQAITIDVGPGKTYPATVTDDYAAVAEFDIVLLAGTDSIEGEFELTLKDDEIYERDETLSVNGTIDGLSAITISPATFTIDDNEDTPEVTLILSPEKITEDGGADSGLSTVTASMSGTASEAVTLEVSATHVSPAAASDIALSSNTTLTIAAGAKASTEEVTITAQANQIDALDKTFKVSAAASGGIDVVSPDDKTLTVEDDDERGVTISESEVPLRETDADENDGITDNEKSYTVRLNSQPAIGSVSITVASESESVATVDEKTLTFSTSTWDEPQTVTISAVDDDIDNDEDKRTTNITHTLSAQGEDNDYVGVTAEKIKVTVEDDDDEPTAMTITVDTNTNSSGIQNTVAENVGSASVRLTVAIDGETRFDDDKTVAVTFGADGDSATATADYTAADFNIKLPRGDASASENFTLTVVDDDLDEPDSETFSIEGSLDGITVAGTTITIQDNETKPTVRLKLSKSNVTEADESVTVTADLTGKSSEDVTLTVAAAAGTRASNDDFTLSENVTLTIAAGTTDSTGTVTIATVDNDIDTDNKTVTVSANAEGGNDVDNPANVDLTIEDDDERGIRISESSVTVNEADIPDTQDNTDKEHQKTYEVVLLSEPTGEVTINVASDDTTIATVSATSLTFDADDWDDPQTVTITAVDDPDDNDGDKRETTITHTVNATGTDYSAVPASDIAVTVNDDEGTPVVSLTLSETSIDENGGATSGSSTVTASMNGTSSQAVTLAISASPEHDGDSGAFNITANKTLTIAAHSLNSTGTVTITAVDNEIHDADKKITVSATASGGNGVAAPASAELKIVNDDVRGVMVSKTEFDLDEEDDGLTSSTTENEGTYTINLTSRPTGTVTVNLKSSDESVATVSPTSITIAPNSNWNNARTVTVTSKADNIDNIDNKRIANITHTLSAGTDYEGLVVPRVEVTVEDDDDPPTAMTIEVDTNLSAGGNQTAVTEGPGVTPTIRVTAKITGDTRFAVPKTVAVSFGKAADSATEGSDYTIVDMDITIPVGLPSASGQTVLTIEDNDLHELSEQFSVEGTLADVTVTGTSVTINDDESKPTLTLDLSAATITENGQTTTVTATLSGKSSEDVELTVAAVPETGTGASVSDFSLTDNKILTIAAGGTDSTETVQITSIDNDIDAANKQVTVSAAASGGNGVSAPSSKILTITDDDERGVDISIDAAGDLKEEDASQTDSKENEKIYNVVLTSEPTGGSVRINIASNDKTVATVSPDSLFFSNSTWNVERDVTITSVNDDIDNTDEERTTTITHEVIAVSTDYENVKADSIAVTVDDDDVPPTAMKLTVDVSSVGEAAGQTAIAVTATITSRTRFATETDVSVDVGKSSDSATEGTDYANVDRFIIKIPAGAASKTESFNLTPTNDTTDEIDETISIEGTLSRVSVTPAAVTITDNDATPTVTLSLSTNSIAENGGSSRVMANLSGTSSEDVTLTVAATPVSPAVVGDFTLSETTTLTIAAGGISSSGQVSVTAVNNNVDAANKQLTISATAQGGHGVANPGSLPLTITDDDTRGITVTPTTVTMEEKDNAGTKNTAEHQKTYKIRLNSEPSGGTVTINTQSADSEVATVLPSSLTFDTSDWSTEKSVVVTAVDDIIDNAGNSRTTTITNSVSAADTDYKDESADPVNVTVNDDDVEPTAVKITVSANSGADASQISINEGATATTVDVTATITSSTRFATSETVAVKVGNSGDTAAETTDYANVADFEIVIPAGAASATESFTLTPTDDAIDEVDEVLSVKGTLAGVTVTDASVKILDNEDTPTVTLSLTNGSISENGGSSQLAASLSGVSSEALTLSVTVRASSGASKNDLTLSGTMLNIPANSTNSNSITISAVDNDIDTDDKEFTVSASATGGHGVGSPESLTLTVQDEDTRGITISSTTLVLDEVDNPSTTIDEHERIYVIVLDSEPTGAVKVSLTNEDETAAVVTPVMHTFTSGNWNQPQAFTVTSKNDNIDNTDDRKTTKISHAVSADGTDYAGETIDDVSVTVNDDDATPRRIKLEVDTNVTSSGKQRRIREPAGQTEVEVTAKVVGSSRFADAQRIDVSVGKSGDTASEGTDYNTISGVVITIPAGAESASKRFNLTPINDTVDETNERITVDGTGLDTPSLNIVEDTITIIDDEGTPTVSLVLGASAIGENAGSTTVTASLDRASGANISLVVAVTPVDPAVAGDFTLSSNTTLTIAAGSLASTETVSITAVDNDIDTPNKELTVSATATTASLDMRLHVEDPVAEKLEITDDDVSGVSISATKIEIDEADDGDTAATENKKIYEIELDSEPIGTVTIDIGSDDTTVATVLPARITFDKDDWDTAQEITVTAVDDDIDNTDDERTAIISHTVRSTEPDYVKVTAASVDIEVADVDETPTEMTVTVDTSIRDDGVQGTVGEGAGSPTMRATVAIVGDIRFATSQTVAITFGKEGDGATNPADYSVSNFNITIPAEMGSASTTFAFTVSDDDLDEPNEQLSVEGQLAGVEITGTSITIEDNDATPTATLSLSPTTINESGQGTTSTVTAALSSKSSQAITIEVAAAAGEGAVSSDFTLSANTTLTIAAGQTASTGTVTVAAVNNEVDAADKEVTVSGTTTGGGVSDPNSQTLTIADEDARGVVVSAASAGVSVAEVDDALTSSAKENEATYTVMLTSEPSGGAVTIEVESEATTIATVSPVSLNFTDTTWNVAQTVTVTGIDDNIDNTGGSRATTITHTVDADDTDYEHETAGSVAVTVNDDEVLPTVSMSLADASISESGGSTTITASLTGKSSEDITLSLSVSPSAGAAAGDLTLSGNSLTIAAGTIQSDPVTIESVNNDIDTANKEFTISATASGGNDIDDPDDQTLTITDDDERGIIVTPVALTVDEVDNPDTAAVSENEKSYEVKLNSQPTGAVTVNINNEHNSVATVSAASLSFGPSDWKTAKSVKVTAVDDNIDNTGGERTASIAHSVAATNTDYNGETALGVTVTVTDDDAAPDALTLSVDTDSATDGEQTELAENAGATTVTVTAEIDGDTRFADDKTVSITIGNSTDDSATEGTDYSATDVTLTLPAGKASVSGTFTLTPTVDSVDEPDETVTVEGSLSSIDTVAAATITITDNNDKPTLSLAITDSDDSISEDGGSTSITASLDGVSSQDVTLTVSTTAVSPAVAADFTQTGTTLTIAAGSTSSTETVTIAAVDNDIDAANKTFTVSATATGGNDIADPANQTLTIIDDDERGVTVSKSAVTVEEADGGASEHQDTYTVVLDSEPTGGTVTINPASGANTIATVSPASLAFTASNWDDEQTVTVTAVDDNVDNTDNERTTQITHTVSAGGTDYSSETVDSVDVTVNDDDGTPVVRLVLTPASIEEDGGSSTGTTTVTATMGGESSEAVTLTVSTAPDGSASASDLTQSGTTLTIAAGYRASTGTVTIAAVDNDIDAANKTFTVSATATGGNDIADPANQTLTITDDDERGVTVSKSAVTVEEADGDASEHQDTYTVVLDSEPTGGTVTINLSSDANTIATVSPASLAFTASNWDDEQTVTVTAVDDDVDNTDNERTTQITHMVSASGTDYSDETVDSVDVTVNDDDGTPTVSLVLTPASIEEDGGSSTGTTTVTATMGGESSEAVTLTVSAAPVGSAAAADITQSGTTLTIAAGSRDSTGTVTIAAVDNDIDAANKTFTVSATATGGNGIAAPDSETLTITDDDQRGVTVSKSAVTVEEADGGSSEHQDTYTVVLDSEPTGGTVTINLSSDANTIATVSPASLAFTASNWESERTVTVTAIDDDIDNANNKRTTQITHTVSAGGTDYSAETVGNVDVTVNDDDGTPAVTLKLTPASIDENGGATSGTSTVTATLSGKSSAAVTVTVAAAAGTNTSSSDFTLSANKTLTIAADTTASTGVVTIAAVDNDVDAPDKSVTVSATATGGGVSDPSDQTLTITDDETTPTVALILDPTTINESGSSNSSTVTATLSGESHEAVTVEVAAAAGTDTSSSDFTLSTNKTLTIAAGFTASTGAVTIAAVDNDVDAPNKSVTVSGTATGGGVSDPSDRMLTIADDEGVPTVTLNLSANSIDESGSDNASTVTATLSGKASAAVEVVVSVPDGAPVTQSGTTLTFAAGTTTSTGTVTITAADNDVDAPNATVAVSGAANGGGVLNPAGLTLTIEDDDERGVSVAADPIVIDEADNAGTSGALEHQSTYTIVLDSEPSGGSVTINLKVVDTNVATIDENSVTFTASNWNRARTITVQAVADQIDNTGNSRTTQITHTMSATGTDYSTITSVPSIAVTVNDDDGAPVVSLVLTPLKVKENGGLTSGVSTVTATMSGASSQQVSLTVSAAANSPATSSDFQLAGSTLTIAAGSRASTGTVTIASIDNKVDSDDKTITVSAVASGGNGLNSPSPKTLTIEDDDVRGVSISKSAIKLSEADDAGTQNTKENQAQYTIELESQPTGTVAVNIASSNTNVATVDKNSVQFTASNWLLPQTVIVTAVQDSVDNAEDKRVTTITHTVSAANTDYEDVSADNVDITVDDDDGSPMISIDNPQVEEGDGEDAKSLEFTVTLAPQSSSTVTVDFADTGTGTASAGTDYEQFASGQLTFAPGEESKKITVTVKPDSNDESDETIVLRLSNPANAGFLGAASTIDGTGTITDNDEAPSVSVGDVVSVREGDDPQTTTEMTFEVSVDAVSVNEVVVNYQLSGTASAASDYVEPAQLMVSIAPGTKTATIAIPIKGDTIDEGLETIVVTLIQPSNANLSSVQGATVATGNIIDDDFTITPELDTIYEDETLAYTVSGIESAYSSLKLRIGQASSASLGSDFKLLSGNDAELAVNHSLTPVNGRIKFKVKALADDVAEIDESIVLILDDSTNSLGVQLGVLALIDGARPVAGVDVSKTSMALVEGGAAGEYTLVLTKAPDPGTSVTITATSNLPSAVAVNASGGTPGPAATLTFTEQNWSREQTVTVVPQLDDDIADAEAVITHSVAGTGSYASVTADSVQVSVQDSGPAMTILDAEADEGEFLEFTVELSAPSTGNVAITWNTLPQTATPNLDYEEVSGTIEFSEGEDRKMVQVFAMNDAVSEPPEMFSVELSSPRNTRLDRGSATGTILDVQTATKEWMARFGRTITEQVIDGIGSRIQHDGTQGIEGTFAGIAFSDSAADHGGILGHASDTCGNGTWSQARHRHERVLNGHCADTGRESKSMSWIDVLTSSSFSLTEEHGDGEYTSMWARGVKSGFDSKEGTVSLSGEVITGMIGADWSSEDSRIGVILSHSEGDGDIEYDNGTAGTVSSSITALVPWASEAISERITIWGAVGYGEGDLSIGAKDDDALTTDMDWSMVAAGVRGKLIEAEKGNGFSLDFASDAFWNRTASDSAQGIAAEEAEVTRLRAGIEGGWRLQIDSGVTLNPTFELGGRYDGGDAETGFGIEFGGGLAWSMPGDGLEFAVEGRSLITHEDEDFETWSYSAQLVYDSKPSTQRGFSSTIGYELDNGATVGVEALLDNGVPTGETDDAIESQWRFTAAYGYAMNGRPVIAKPNFSYVLGESSREYQLGWQFIPVRRRNDELSLEIVADYAENEGERPESGIMLTIGGRW